MNRTVMEAVGGQAKNRPTCSQLGGCRPPPSSSRLLDLPENEMRGNEMKGRLLLSAFVLTVVGAVAGLSQAAPGQLRGAGGTDFASFSWTEVRPSTPPGPASWAPRAGLQAVELRDSVFVMGGRTPLPPVTIPGLPFPVPVSTIWQDVWRSGDRGATWSQVTPGASWPARAYFQAVTKGGEMFVLGGQNFKAGPGAGCTPPAVSCSDFFNDVWSSRDGADWKLLTPNAGWQVRAGLSAIVHRGAIYVLGGSQNDDASTVPGAPPSRIYFNDVWKSKDGRRWTRVVERAPWKARAGAVLVEKEGWIYLLGGEEGFTCSDPTKPCPPYFNDVWRSRDGAKWERVTPAADWSPRPGHQCAVLLDRFVCFGGFGLPPFGNPLGPPSNPMDIWESKDGDAWTLVAGSPWNATQPLDVKYDFDVLVLKGGRGGKRPSIYTFGGDRETFDFLDPGNYLRVDNDVWRFGPS